MEAQLPALLAIAIMTLVAVTTGLIMVWLKQPPMVGYILAGVVLGPTVIGFIPRVDGIPLLAEFGVLFLLFVVGMEISLRAFLVDIRPAALTVLLQLTFAFLAVALFGALIGWPIEQIVLLTFVVTLSSTAVTLKILHDLDELRSELGRIVVAVMIAQDIAIVPMLIVVHALGSGGSLELSTLWAVVLAIAVLALFVGLVGPRGKFQFPWQDQILGRVELVTLTAIAVCCTSAVITGLAGLTPAYGAFLAGLIIGKSTLRSEAIPAMRPIEGALMVIFFVAMGLLLDVGFIAENLVLVATWVFLVLLLKSLVNIMILKFVGLKWTDAYQAGLVMGQIGEFSFVLAAAGFANKVLDPTGYKLAISVIVLSLLFSPLWVTLVRQVHNATESGIEGLRQALIYAEDGDRGQLSRFHFAVLQLYRILPGTLRAVLWPAGQDKSAATDQNDSVAAEEAGEQDEDGRRLDVAATGDGKSRQEAEEQGAAAVQAQSDQVS